jgi:SPP1 Gp6-like portal protein
MPLDKGQAIDKVKELRESASAERAVLDDIRRYWTGRQALPRVIPKNAAVEVRRMARLSRINVIALVVESLSQSLFVDGFRGKQDSEDAAVWSIWQANKLDARQTGIHRAALAYGTSYALVLPGDPVPVIRGCSPRALHAVYGEDPDWPVWALYREAKGAWRLYDSTNVYWLKANDRDELEYVDTKEHGAGVTPVVRFREVEDLDLEDEPTSSAMIEPLETVESEGLSITLRQAQMNDDTLAIGQVSPLMTIQDQIDVTTFNLMVAMHFAAFKQRYILGWTGADEVPDEDDGDEDAARRRATLSATASRMWTFDDENIKVGELGETSLEGYIKTRESSLRHAASLSQTPAHELIGELVNMSAEALAAAEAGRDRKVADRETLFGEAHEQALRLAGKYAGVDVPQDAQVRWRDTSARSFAATVDALGKLVTMLGVPASELWERIPGVTKADIERWQAQAAQGDAFAGLTDVLNRQGAGGPAPAPSPGPAAGGPPAA